MRITLGCWGLGLWALLGKYGTTTVCLECRLDLMSSLLPSFVFDRAFGHKCGSGCSSARVRLFQWWAIQMLTKEMVYPCRKVYSVGVAGWPISSYSWPFLDNLVWPHQVDFASTRTSSFVKRFGLVQLLNISTETIVCIVVLYVKFAPALLPHFPLGHILYWNYYYMYFCSFFLFFITL